MAAPDRAAWSSLRRRPVAERPRSQARLTIRWAHAQRRTRGVAQLLDEPGEAGPLQLQLAHDPVAFGFGQALARDIAEDADRHPHCADTIEDGGGFDGEPALAAGEPMLHTDDALRHDAAPRRERSR